ncbi:hypothetical protein P7L87_25040 [Vibrio parahaemolyticus]|nr:hypothetical protein [Vibrio parahaemolyticus]
MIDFTSPNTVAFLQFIGLGFLGVVAAFGQWFGRRKGTAPPASKDVLVPSLTIADNQVIAEATSTLRDANRIARDHREHDEAILYTLIAIKDSHQRIESLLGRMIDRLPR